MARFRLGLLVLSAALAFAAAPTASAEAACRGADRAISGKVSKNAARATLCLVNAERRAHGLRPLRANARLKRAGRLHARDMVRYRYFSHTSRQGLSPGTRIRRTGYGRRGASVGENLYWGTGSRSTPRSTVAAWMASPGHRANILRGAYRHLGVGIAAGTPSGHRGGTYAAAFGG